jgi:predicted phage terminase large subunit-like protein
LKTDLSALPVDNLWKLFPDTYATKASNGFWIPYRHLKFALRRVAKGLLRKEGGYNAIISMPASYGKSKAFSVWLPIWYMETFPRRKVMETGYSSAHVNVFAKEVRDEIKFNPKVSIKLAEGSKGADDFKTTAGNEYWAAGIGGALTGHHFHLGIIDDPIKEWDEALSENFREKIKNWYHSVFYKRRMPNSSMIVVMTRWHEDDLAGYLQEKEADDWDVINLPALAERGDLMGRPTGECLCPELYPQEHVEGVKAKTPPIIWDALDQQHPSAVEGNVIKRAWWKYYTELPGRFDEVIMCADMNMDEDLDNDRTAYVVMARRGSSIYILHVFREIMDFDRQIPKFIETVKMFPRVGAKLVENKANGPAVESFLKRKIPGIQLVEPEGGKFSRVMGVLELWTAGNIFVPNIDDPKIAVKYPWVKDYLNEHANFPQGRYDDQVDATSMGLLYFRKAIQQGLKFYQ